MGDGAPSGEEGQGERDRQRCQPLRHRDGRRSRLPAQAVSAHHHGQLGDDEDRAFVAQAWEFVMIDEADLKPVAPTGAASTALASHISSGLPIPPALRVQVFSPDDWEMFTEEYASSLEAAYVKVRRFGG